MNQPNTPPTTSHLAPRPDPEPATIPAVRLDTCPFCGYPLEGLPSAGRCPECGLAYDENTYILRAITRGTSGMSKSRAALWILVAVSAWLGMSIGPQLFMLGGLPIGISGGTFLLTIWGTLVTYLILTGKKHRGQKGVEYFIFCAERFGPCTLQHGNSAPVDTELTRWSEVDGLTFEKKGSNFQRLRIGRNNPRNPSRRLKEIVVDVGLRCNPSESQTLARFISDRINGTDVGAETRPAENDKFPLRFGES